MSLQDQGGLTAPAAGKILRFASVAAIFFTLASAAFAVESSRAIKVERVNFPVTLSDGKPYNVAGYLYYLAAHGRVDQSGGAALARAGNSLIPPANLPSGGTIKDQG